MVDRSPDSCTTLGRHATEVPLEATLSQIGATRGNSGTSPAAPWIPAGAILHLVSARRQIHIASATPVRLSSSRIQKSTPLPSVASRLGSSRLHQPTRPTHPGPQGLDVEASSCSLGSSIFYTPGPPRGGLHVQLRLLTVLGGKSFRSRSWLHVEASACSPQCKD